MRGIQNRQAAMFSYVSQEDRIPQNHPLRILRKMVDPILQELSGRFDALYAGTGRPSIPPEQLLRALLVQILYTIRSERLLMEQLEYNLLFRWFVGLSMDDAVWNHSVFSKNRDRLLEGDIANVFLRKVLTLARRHRLLSNEHFTVDGTLIEAWAGQKSFRPKADPPMADKKKDDAPGSTTDDPGNPTVNFHGERRTNDTHQSTTDPEARLVRKGPGKEAKLSFMGHVTIDNRHGLVIAARYTYATGKAEREAATAMAKCLKRRRKGRKTLGADKAYDTQDFVKQMRKLEITPHVAQNDTRRSSAIDNRTTRHAGYAVSQRKRKLVEEIFGWLKTIGLMRKTRHKGVKRGGWMFTFTNAIYNLIRIKNIVGQAC
jgi:transposase